MELLEDDLEALRDARANLKKGTRNKPNDIPYKREAPETGDTGASGSVLGGEPVMGREAHHAHLTLAI
jgi:hypothetical protein